MSAQTYTWLHGIPVDGHAEGLSQGMISRSWTCH